VPLLRNAALAVIPVEKLTRYFLYPESPDGASKARVFKAALGFSLANHSALALAIRQVILAHEAAFLGLTPHGELWRVDLPITGPSGTALVRTGWFYQRGSDVPKLTTAYVLRRR
jgi:hypothetical protein